MDLGVNIDHIATLRNARMGVEPSVLEAAFVAQNAGASQITTHLREDRRHIKDEDVYLLKEELKISLNLEMAATEEMEKIALDVVPHSCCIVPEKRLEITTEGGLDVIKFEDRIKKLNDSLHSKNILVSLFIDADPAQVEAAKRTNADYIELHTGFFANAFNKGNYEKELEKLQFAASLARDLNLKVNAGHGLNYENVKLMHKIPMLYELNIGHSIISRAVFVGLDKAVKDMINLI
ncbi:TPA: pyridoxine 5'-phosphate synthase [Candidatus Galligastranaerophilus gallistercoris]|nr:pyridoxine 5'-phosphate synthase [Candidatus Galligastranaerophilus gallistercoris]